MALETALAFLKSADSRKSLPPAIVIFGPHPFLREAVLASIVTRLLESGYQYRSFHISSNADFDRALEEARAPDLFAAMRIVVCRVLKAHRERAADTGAGTDDETERAAGASRGGEAAVAEALESARGPNHLVLVYERDNAPAKIRKAAEKSALFIGCGRPYDNQIPEYADALARARQMRLGPDAAVALAQRHAGDLAAIANAIAKAAIFAEAGQPIGPDDLNDPGIRRMPDVFEIADSLARGRAAAALAQIDRAVALGRDSIEILAVEIIPVMRRMMTAAAMLSRRRSPGEIAAALGVPPMSGLATRAIEGARRFGPRRLERAYRRAAELDEGFKNGMIKEREQAIGALLIELMGAQDSPHGTARA
ncbi:MAG: DNA polymerase III subunit delta [Candidatus Binataceae bacterium]